MVEQTETRTMKGYTTLDGVEVRIAVSVPGESRMLFLARCEYAIREYLAPRWTDHALCHLRIEETRERENAVMGADQVWGTIAR